MSRGVVVLLWIVGVIVVLLSIALLIGMNGMKKTLRLQIRDVDLSSVPDGTYRGSYEGGRFSNTVEVQVADHKIVSVRIIKDQLGASSSPLGRQLLDRVVEKQSLSVRVDAVSGATATTHGYLKAIENALRDAGAR